MKKTQVIVLLIIIVLVGGGCFWIWNKYTGKFKIGADAIIGCQNPRQISQTLGRPGSNLTPYELFGKTVSINKRIVPFLDSIQKDIKAAKIEYSFDEIQTYNYRSKIGGGGQSLHSWGMAIDINPDRNPYQLGVMGAPQTDIPGQAIDIFKRYGFQWGGDWVGQRDPMHFEWYGTDVSGSIIDFTTGQKITNAAVTINGSGAPLNNGDFDWFLESTHPHEVNVSASGYEVNSFKLELFCFQDRKMEIAMKPLAENIPGSISGKVKLVGDRAPVIPATIILDGKAVGATNVKGDYYIPGVKKGEHKVEAKILFFPGSEPKSSELKPGDNLRDINLVIGE